MNLEKLIAEAWEQERARCQRWATSRGGIVERDGKEVFAGRHAECNAYIDKACARAVMRALQEAGYAVVPERHANKLVPSDDGGYRMEPCNLIPAAIAEIEAIGGEG